MQRFIIILSGILLMLSVTHAKAGKTLIAQVNPLEEYFVKLYQVNDYCILETGSYHHLGKTLFHFHFNQSNLISIKQIDFYYENVNGKASDGKEFAFHVETPLNHNYQVMIDDFNHFKSYFSKHELNICE